jgi:hypothetical protein
MTYSSRAGSRSPGYLNDRQSGTILTQAPRNAERAGNLLANLKPTLAVAKHDTTRPEINISGNQLLVAFVVAFCLAGPLVWLFVRYWVFAP